MEYHIKEGTQPMTAQREVAIMEAAIAKWGENAQIGMAIEEMSELTKALCKYARVAGHADADSDLMKLTIGNILEEMADVSIMLSQMELIFGDPTDWEIRKLERLAKRIGME